MLLIRYLVSRLKFFEYKKKLAKTKNIDIMKKVRIHNLEKVEFGEYVYIGPECEFMAAGGLEIGSNVIFGPKVKIWTENHNFKSKVLVPYDSILLKRKVIIHDNVWIGYGAMIAPGTIIGEGAVIGMGAVVRGEIPPLAIVFGNPSEVISYRDDKEYKDIVLNKGYYYKKKKENENLL